MDYLDLIKKTWQPDMEDKVLFAMIGVAGEAGEIANMAQKAARGDFKAAALSLTDWVFPNGEELRKHQEQREKLIGEMGGVFYFLTALAWQLGVTPEEIMQRNKEKLLARLERGTIRGDGDDR